ncbi:MAG: flagellar filament protein FlaA [Spirochaetaceae bacterium]|nr:MAG: flagellar filament protein FlaA [Spirochaetaceae bacterium]
MKMRTLFLGLTVLVLVATGASAQFGRGIDATQLGQDVAQQRLVEISVTKFEDAGFFRAGISSDYGLTEWRRFEGGPAMLEPIPEEEELGFTGVNEHVLGVKTTFFRRGTPIISIEPIRPIAIPGQVRTMSVWVAGRNTNHRLVMVVEDIRGDIKYINMGNMNFTGWRRLTVAIPPNIIQRDPMLTDREGLMFRGFMVQTDLMQTYGTYFVYFDDLRAVTDLFSMEMRDEDDMVDGW